MNNFITPKLVLIVCGEWIGGGDDHDDHYGDGTPEPRNHQFIMGTQGHAFYEWTDRLLHLPRHLHHFFPIRMDLAINIINNYNKRFHKAI